ncbi:MAG: hypothetical protein SPI53_04925 [Erysipelotrichaceae bacterium]|nr:hypothetical protein [Erysipelotrichaceae bacterium]
MKNKKLFLILIVEAIIILLTNILVKDAIWGSKIILISSLGTILLIEEDFGFLPLLFSVIMVLGILTTNIPFINNPYGKYLFLLVILASVIRKLFFKNKNH